MVRIQLTSLDEFIASLSKLDYDTAKTASSKVMENHIQMGTLMFSLLTVEMTYTSMDYLKPSNFKRGNRYASSMYRPLARRLNRLLNKLVADYEEEYQSLVTCHDHNHNHNHGTSGQTVHNLHTQKGWFDASGYGGEDSTSRSAFHPVDMDLNGNQPTVFGGQWFSNSHSDKDSTNKNKGTSDAPHDPFDPDRYVANLEEAEQVLKELETLKLFIRFMVEFVEMRRIMVVFYRFIMMTGPVLYMYRTKPMLAQCKEILDRIEPDPLYECLLEHARHEIKLVSNLLHWDHHISTYNFVASATHMKQTKDLLKSWQDTLPVSKISTANSADHKGSQHTTTENTPAQGGGSILYSALAKSSRIVQNMLWGGSGSGSEDSDKSSTSGRMRAIVLRLEAWTGFMTFKTTFYFQRLIAPHRSMLLANSKEHTDPLSLTWQDAVMKNIWSRSGLSQYNLCSMITKFMSAHDCCFVSLLFESSKQHPFAPDGCAVPGTRLKVSDYRVQACAVLFCLANHKLLRARNIHLTDTLVNDVHTDKPIANLLSHRQTDVEWFRQNCLPDILYVLDKDQKKLECEMLGTNSLLSQLGSDADDLVLELGRSVEELLNEITSAHQLDTLTSENEVHHHGYYSDEDAHEEDIEATETLDLPLSSFSRLEQSHLGELEDSHSNISNDNNSEYGNYGVDIGSDRRDNDGEDNQDLYSNYLSKSHLRNNDIRDRRTRGGNKRSRRRFVGRHSSLVLSAEQDVDTNDISAIPVPSKHPNYGYLSLQKPLANVSKAKQRASLLLPAVTTTSANKIAGEMSNRHPPTATIDVEGTKGHAYGQSLSGLSDMGSRMDPLHGSDATKSATKVGEPQKRSIDTPKRAPPPPRSTLSIRSFFQGVPKQNACSHHQSQGSGREGPENTEMARRLHYGELVLNSFGRWDAMGDDDGELQASNATDIHNEANSRRGSFYSLSYSTPVRSSIGQRRATDVVHCSPTHQQRQIDTSSNKMTSQLPKLSNVATPLLTSVSTTFPVAVSATTDAKATNTSRKYRKELPISPMGGVKSLEHLHQYNNNSNSNIPLASPFATQSTVATPVAIAPSNVAPAVPAAPATSPMERYTYLYSRVGLPNVSLVAVLLDTDKGVNRRREAERAWNDIVDVVRGVSAF